METRELICIRCPLGCMMEVTIDGGEVVAVKGNTCPRGEVYAKKEVTNPTRMITSTVIVEGGELKMVSVATASDIPKGKIFDCMKELKGIKVTAPIFIGDVVKKDICHTGVDIVATKEVLQA
ncbi:MAG: DUF1667 domain-containing protein [Bacillota bacterium]